MTLNSHFQRHERLVMARSVLVDEVTAAYEKLHATVSLGNPPSGGRSISLRRARGIRDYGGRLAASGLLGRAARGRPHGCWASSSAKQTTDTVVLRDRGHSRPGRLEGWRAPRLEPLDVVGSVTVLGLLVEDRLKAESFQTEGLIPVDVSVLGKAWGNAPQLRPVAAWYAPQGDYALTARYNKPPAELAVTTSLLLVLADKGQEVLGGLALVPQVEKRFSFDVSVPAGWQVTSVTAADGRPLPFDRYSPRPLGEGRNPLSLGEGPGVRAPDVANSPHPNPLPKGEGTRVEPLPKGEGTGRPRPRHRAGRHERRRGVSSPLPRRPHAAGLAGRLAIADGRVSRLRRPRRHARRRRRGRRGPRRSDCPPERIEQLTPLAQAGCKPVLK